MKSSFRLAATAVLTGAAASLLASAPAQAAVVDFGGVLYDVTVLETSFDSSATDFERPASGGKMPWWGSQADADFFAEQVFTSLGEGSTAGSGPLFAYEHNGSLFQVIGTLQDVSIGSVPGVLSDETRSTTATVKYAIATAPVPGPLPLFGAAAAFGWSRQLRRRIRIR
jgi:hypothetical protein